MRSGVRGGGGGGAAHRGAASLLEEKISWNDATSATAWSWICGLTTVETIADGGCCCALQQEGRRWLTGDCLGQWSQEDCFGCAILAQVAALTRSVRRQSSVAKRCKAFFIFGRFDEEAGTMDTCAATNIWLLQLYSQVSWSGRCAGWGLFSCSLFSWCLFSWSRSQRLRSMPPPYPVREPLDPMTR